MRALLAAAGAATSFAAAPVAAQQTQTAQYACFVPGSGTIYRIKEPKTPAQCGAGHVEFQMSAGTKPSSGPTGPAGGDLGGSYPDPLVMKLQGHPVLNSAGSFDFSNPNGLVSIGTPGTGVIPATGVGTRFMWYPAKRALRAGTTQHGEWEDANIGDASVAFGNAVKASGTNSFAVGSQTTASGASSVALGEANVAAGGSSTALGTVATARGFGATAIGAGVNADGNGSTAIGSLVNAVGNGAVAIGFEVVADGDRSMALGNHATTYGTPGAFVYGDASTDQNVPAAAANQFVVRAQRFWLGSNNAVTATAGRFLETTTGAYLTTGGAWTNSSDVNRKHAFERIDADSVLDKIAAMPVQTWSYKTEADSVRHMGPTAQDFRRAFGLGDTDKAIATVDADGVSLAGIKALVQRTSELRRENQELRAALADLYRRLSELEIVRREP